jgi:Flp pilus assembly protein TadD
VRGSLLLLVFAGACATNAHIKKVEVDGERLRLELAETYITKGAYDAALPLLQRELATKPKDAHLRTLYGTVLRERGLYPQAEKELLSAVQFGPRHAQAWAALGILYDLMRRPADAQKAHRRAIQIAPGHAPYWNNLGFSLYVTGETTEAIRILEKALALDPSMTVAYNNLGFAYGRRKDYASAERSFRTAGGEVAAWLNLALVYEQNGDDETAARLRTDALQLNPDAVEEHR